VVKVKICGITNLEDALLACELGAHALGFVLYSKSARYIEPKLAAAIVQAIPIFVTTVGVCVNMPIAELNPLCQQLPLSVIQLHGDESPDYCRQVELPCIKAFRVTESFDPAQLQHYPTAAFLLDAYVDASTFGGTGKVFDWRIARDAKRFGRIVLSGGLHAGNVSAAVRLGEPYAVDVSTGVETHPGKKDEKKLRAFFEGIQRL
jgi:phosphoribosylanthranilate isomerase